MPAEPTEPTTDATPVRVVGVALLRVDPDGQRRLLAAQRAKPPALAGLWEFPGGKVEVGESDAAALARECVEELGVDVVVGAQVGPDVMTADGRAVLRVYLGTLVADDAQPCALDHAAIRWVAADELDALPWIPADEPVVRALQPLLDEHESALQQRS